MGIVFKNGRLEIEAEAGMLEGIAAYSLVGSAAVVTTAAAVGGTAAAASVAVPAAGVAAAGATAYIVANTVTVEGDEVDVISHTQPNAVVDYVTDSTIPPDASAGDDSRCFEPNDPKIRAALQNFHEYQSTMQDLGFIKLDEDQKYTTSNEYGCPSLKPRTQGQYTNADVAANAAGEGGGVDGLLHTQPNVAMKYVSDSTLPANMPTNDAPHCSTAMADPKILKALQNFNGYKSTMLELGFKLEKNQNYTTSKEYGCPSAKAPILQINRLTH